MASKPKLYNGWFCPFAQRAWIALLEKGVDFELLEVNPYNKTPEWLAINPKGFVPTIVHNGRSVYESPICIEYVDEAWTTDRQLLPTDPYERARARIWSDHISKKLVPPFYSMLLKKEESEREEAKKNVLDALEALVKEMDPQGPFFSGSTPDLVDIMLFPFAFRFETILPHYRGFSIPTDEHWKRYHVWYSAAKERESMKKTLPDVAKLIEVYQEYADGTAKSKLAEALRKGKQIE